MGVRLPSEYQEVEYIATGASGNQYIATDILGQKDLIIESDQMPTNVNDDHYIFGWQGELYSGGTALQYLCHGGSYNTNYEGGYGSYFLVSNKIHNNIRYHVVSDFTSGNAKVYLDGSQIWSSTVVIPDFETERKFLLFSGMNRTGDPVYYWKGYLYSFCVKKQQRTIADFIPCYRKSDNKPGMYDLVSGEFFTNAGTGEFEVGLDAIDSISPLMVAWRRAMMEKKSDIHELPLIYFKGLDRRYNVYTDMGTRASTAIDLPIKNGQTMVITVPSGIEAAVGTWDEDTKELVKYGNWNYDLRYTPTVDVLAKIVFRRSDNNYVTDGEFAGKIDVQIGENIYKS